MSAAFTFSPQRLLWYLAPAALAGLIAGLSFLLIGQTPLLRAGGLAAAVVGITLSLRRMGGLMSIAGGLALAYSPAFWAQTGGGSGSTPATIVLALGAAVLLGVVLLVALAQRPYVAVGVALVLFVGVFLSGVGEPRSLRLTVLASAWLLYLLTQAIMETNPRPDERPAARLRASYRAGILLILAAATLNDPLFVLWVPAVVLGLAGANTRIPWWYWVAVLVIGVFGLRGVVVSYTDPVAWGMTIDAAGAVRGGLPYLVAEGWRNGARWVDTFALLAAQFTGFGVALGLVGLARMSRWYPTLGPVMMVAYACFFAFGLAYFGRDRSTLLLPLLMIQVFFMTYAVHAVGQWVAKALRAPETVTVRWVAPIGYALIPLTLLTQIVAAR
ncbi:MAG: hypothetical protein MUF38_01965 [Anaerolineae bacterium]|jgi:hypothetical protein|nr:hypothetical protein [Anaerolineae bacterium]